MWAATLRARPIDTESANGDPIATIVRLSVTSPTRTYTMPAATAAGMAGKVTARYNDCRPTPTLWNFPKLAAFKSTSETPEIA